MQLFAGNSKHLKELSSPIYFSYDSLHKCMTEMTNSCTVTICTGGVSMGDKDFVKEVLSHLNMDLNIGRVNMKPG